MSELRLLSYNTWKCDGLYPQRLSHARKVLEQEAVDIYLLQEVFMDEEGRYNTLSELFPHRESLHILFQAARFKSRIINNVPVNGYSGQALVSRYPIISHGYFSLPAHPLDPHRFCQWGVITIDETAVAVFNTHLTHLDGQQALRQRQINRIAEFAKKLPYPVAVIGGDMNSEPFSCLLSGEWECCYQESQPTTLNIDGEGCLDHFYLHRSSTPYVSWCETRLLLDQPVAGIWPSDHKAVCSCIDGL